MQPFYCSSCGKQNPPDAKFCNECAKPIFYSQPVQAPEPQPVNAPANPDSWGYKLGTWWAARSQNQKGAVIFILVIGAIGIFVLLTDNPNQKGNQNSSATIPAAPKPEPPPKRTELNAEVRFNGTQYIGT